MRRVLLCLIRVYQRLLSPMIRPSCRFFPTCSCYAYEAIVRYGAYKGSRMAITRLSRCHPWNPGGYDPVDPSFDKSDTSTVQLALPESRLN